MTQSARNRTSYRSSSSGTSFSSMPGSGSPTPTLVVGHDTAMTPGGRLGRAVPGREHHPFADRPLRPSPGTGHRSAAAGRPRRTGTAAGARRSGSAVADRPRARRTSSAERVRDVGEEPRLHVGQVAQGCPEQLRRRPSFVEVERAAVDERAGQHADAGDVAPGHPVEGLHAPSPTPRPAPSSRPRTGCTTSCWSAPRSSAARSSPTSACSAAGSRARSPRSRHRDRRPGRARRRRPSRPRRASSAGRCRSA